VRVDEYAALDAVVLAGQAANGLLAVDKLNWSEYHAWFGEMAVEELGLDGLVRPDGEDYPLTMFQRSSWKAAAVESPVVPTRFNATS